MEPQDAVDLAREAIWTTLLIGSPILAAALVVGLVVGLLQAVTQIQEQTLAFVPKMIAILLLLSFLLPWLISQMLHYTNELIAGIPARFH
jgi:flagellar biosynthetic protein FliQ